MKFKLILFCLVVSAISNAQTKRCGTDELLKSRIDKNPQILFDRQLQENKLQQTIQSTGKKRLHVTFPVVVHVLYNKDVENISDAQILSQIDALNRDYNNLNSDSLKTNHPFYSLVGNLGVHFELAKIDENGNPSSGITRTKVSKVSWGDDDLQMDNVKYVSDGGVANWNPTKYLNIYSVRFADSVKLLGYAFFPDELAKNPNSDGVVIDFRCFGTNGTAGLDGFDAYKLGRTVTHEVGHWLGLNHIWGLFEFETDKKCGDDLVADTPPAEGSNSGEPTFPHRPNNKCGSGPNGEMYMNYMDYVHDNSMVMFTKGQVSRMQSAILTYRKSFVNKASLEDLTINDVQILKVNPINSNLEINQNFIENGIMQIYDLVGNKCLTKNISPDVNYYDVSELTSGEYTIIFSNDTQFFRSKFIKL